MASAEPGRPRPLRRLRDLARARWKALLATPDGPERVARGAAAGAFAAMIPTFGLHVAVALGAALLTRGSLAAAAASCVLIGNPLTHVVVLPIAYELGRWLVPVGTPGPGWLPTWLREVLPLAEEALIGGALLGVAAAVLTFFTMQRVLSGPRRSDQGQDG
jgi:uncharacterized protein (DUF2062 family)